MEKISWKFKTGESRDETTRETMNLKKNIIQMIEEKQLGWFSHVMRIEDERFPRVVFEWEPEGRRRRSCPTKTWISDVTMTVLNLGLTINDSLNKVLLRRSVFS